MRAVLALLAVFVAGCQPAEATRAGLVVARVNGVEISALHAASPQALESVIDRELLVQKALEAGLERDPQVALSIEHARRQVLAQAWIERHAGAAAQATPEEVRRFYAENAALFSERRVYRLQELAVSLPGEMFEALRAEAARTPELAHLAAWLRARNLKFTEIGLTQPAELLPLRYLPQLARMQPGEIAVFAAPSGASVVQLVSAAEAPLGEKQAAPVIERFLAGRKRLEIAAAEAKRLRGSARIEYVGDFTAR
ncbi:MAG TPA: EpsD family peptidyl-prolyl cis-trans isomerase [Burkholderiales bacterium]|nr:EpsD family peptidyl-prolyl cis-trans isomerase [Burkholderiales bacterium]